MPTCDKATTDRNETQALKLKVGYRDVTVKEVISVDRGQGTVKIRAVSATGEDVPVDVPWRTGVVWPFCPSTLLANGEFQSVPPFPEPSAIPGILFMTPATIQALKLRGGGTKWPLALPVAVSAFEKIVPVSPKQLHLTCVEAVDDGHPGRVRTVDLLDPALAPQPQTLEIDGTAMVMNVKLTREGRRRLGLDSDDAQFLAKARDIIENSKNPALLKDPALLAEAWSVVAGCKSLHEAGKWDEKANELGGDDAAEILAGLLGP